MNVESKNVLTLCLAELSKNPVRISWIWLLSWPEKIFLCVSFGSVGFCIWFLWRWSLILEACVDQIETCSHLSHSGQCYNQGLRINGAWDQKNKKLFRACFCFLYLSGALLSPILASLWSSVSFFFWSRLVFSTYLPLLQLSVGSWYKCPLRTNWNQLFLLLTPQERELGEPKLGLHIHVPAVASSHHIIQTSM